MGTLESSLAGRKLTGLKTAFLVEASGACQHQGGDKNAIVQSADLIRQIHDIVGLPDMDGVMLATDSHIFYAQIKPGAVAGAITGNEGRLDEIQAWLDTALGATTASAGVAGGKEILARMKKVATEYLKDFADMALMVQIKQAGVNEADPSRESLEKLVAGLEKASAMIVGPSVTKEMTGKLRDLLK
jgi:hypothetical protein